MHTIHTLVPGLHSGKLKQIILSIPAYLHEITQLHTPRDFSTWFYFKFPYVSDVPDFPPYVNLGLTGKCNLTCRHCFRNLEAPLPNDMDLPLFEKVVREVANHPQTLLKVVGVGEPAFHPQIQDVMHLLAESKAKTMFYTNGSLFDHFSPHQIVQFAFHTLVVSVDGLDAKSYELIRVGGNYSALKANVEALHRARAELRSHSPIIHIRHVIFPNEQAKDLNHFRRKWLEIADTVKFNYLIPLARHPRATPPSTFTRCRDIRRQLYVGPEGLVPLCGYRSLTETKEDLGDLHHTTIQEIWQHPRLNEVRQYHRKRDLDKLPFCKTCTEIIV